MTHFPTPGQAWSLTGSTGIMAASLAQNAVVFAMGAVATDATRPNILPRGPLEIEGLRLTYTAIVAAAAAAPLTLQVFKGTVAMPTGGTTLTALPKRTNDAGADSGLIGNAAAIATTAGLTAGSFARGTVPLATFDVSASTVVANRLTFDFFRKWNGGSLWLDQGELLVVSNPAAFPAVLTWTLTVNVDYRRKDTV
jgi:hypothetical protein